MIRLKSGELEWLVIDSTQFVAVGMITHTIVANDDRFLSFGMHINKSNWEAFSFPDTILSSVYHTGPPEHWKLHLRQTLTDYI